MMAQRTHDNTVMRHVVTDVDVVTNVDADVDVDVDRVCR